MMTEHVCGILGTSDIRVPGDADTSPALIETYKEVPMADEATTDVPRRAISRRLRFEILRRDNHTCRYCGATAPDVALTVDHVTPRALGGTDEPTNLVAACRDCNFGKASTAPDPAIVADVDERALVWAAAIRQATADVMADIATERAIIEKFIIDWETLCRDVRLPTDWMSTITTFIRRGIDAETMEHLLLLACGRDREQRFRYFCGCCWRTIDRINAEANRAINAGGGG